MLITIFYSERDISILSWFFIYLPWILYILINCLYVYYGGMDFFFYQPPESTPITKDELNALVNTLVTSHNNATFIWDYSAVLCLFVILFCGVTIYNRS